MAGALMGRAAGSATALITSTGRISKILLPTGTEITAKKARNFLLRFGLDAALLLGLDALTAAELVVQKPRRRRRGITYRDIHTARRTACMVSKMARDLNVKPAARTRSTCR